MNRLQDVRTSQEQELKHIKAVIEHVPVPLLSIHNDCQVTVWNNSARRLFGTHVINHVRDFAQFDESFPAKLKALTLGERQLLNLEIDGVELRDSEWNLESGKIILSSLNFKADGVKPTVTFKLFLFKSL